VVNDGAHAVTVGSIDVVAVAHPSTAVAPPAVPPKQGDQPVPSGV